MIRGTVIGGQAVVERFQKMPERLRVELRVGVGRAALMVQKLTKEKLSDQVLHVRTGRLRRSINVRQMEDAAEVKATIGTNVSYAAVHEFGFTGTVNVKGHLRHATITAKVRGIAKFDAKTMTLKKGRLKTVKLRGAESQVMAHTRKVNVPERSFLRSALNQMRPEIKIEFQHAVQRALQ